MIQSILYLVFLNVLAGVPIARVKMGAGKVVLITLLLLTDLFYLCNLPHR
jgi:hypothetical protein